MGFNEEWLQFSFGSFRRFYFRHFKFPFSQSSPALLCPILNVLWQNIAVVDFYLACLPACLCVLFHTQRCPFVSYGTPSRRLHFSRPWRLLLSNYNPDHCFATLHLLGRKQKETIARPVRERSAAHSPSPSPIQLCTRHGAHKWRKFKSLNIN